MAYCGKFHMKRTLLVTFTVYLIYVISMYFMMRYQIYIMTATKTLRTINQRATSKCHLYKHGCPLQRAMERHKVVRVLKPTGSNGTQLSCPEIQSSLVPRDAHWQTDEPHIAYVYSAHLDIRNHSSTVRIFAAIRHDILLDSRSRFCQLWIDKQLVESVEAEIENMELGEVHLIASMDALCTFKYPHKKLPETFAVSLSRNPCQEPNNMLLVRNHIIKTHQTEFTVCLWRPTYSIDQPLFLTEWFELNRLLGAKKFIMYNKNITCPKIINILNHYRKMKLLEIYAWDIPDHLEEEHTHAHLQMVMIGDCQYRNLYRTKYIVGIDLDEFIVPRETGLTSWNDIIQQSRCSKNAVYLMRHLYYDSSEYSIDDVNCPLLNNCTGCSCSNAACNPLINIRTLCKTHRFDIKYAKHSKADRSKYIARPNLVDRMAVHIVWPRRQMCIVDPEIGALHHYRHKILGHVEDDTRDVYDNRLKWVAETLTQNMYRVCMIE